MEISYNDKYFRAVCRALKENDVFSIASLKNIKRHFILIQLLCKYNVLNEYIVYRKQWMECSNMSLRQYSFFVNLHCAFRWDNTKEGRQFWFNIATECADLTEEF